MRRPNRRPDYGSTASITNYEGAADYIVIKDGSDYVAINGGTGSEDSRNATASTVIQYAIDAVNTAGGGTVRLKVPEVTLTATIQVKADVVLDMTGTIINVTANVNALWIRKSGEAFGGEITVEDITATFTKACIYLDTADEINTRWSACVHDMELTGDAGGWDAVTDGYGIFLDGGNAGNIYSAKFDCMYIRNFANGIRLLGTTGYIAGNIFNNILIHNCTIPINLSGAVGLEGNLFTSFMIQPSAGPVATTIAINCDGASNIFQGFIFDKASITDIAIDVSGTSNWFYLNLADADYRDTDGAGIRFRVTPGRVYARILDAFYGVVTPRINDTGADHLLIFGNVPSATTAFIYLYGRDGADALKRTEMRTWGTDFRITSDTTQGIYLDSGTDVVSIDDILKIVPQASAPGSPAEGWIYVNSTDHHLYFYNGSAWVQCDN